MGKSSDLNVFLRPKSVAVIGASQKPRSWGSAIMEALLSRPYTGKLYPVNLNEKSIYDIPAYKDVREINGPVDLAIFIIPEQAVEETITACSQKQVKGIIIVTSGFGEVSETGIVREKSLVKLAHSYGIRLLGPNVSGVYNIYADFVAARTRTRRIRPTALAAISQGGFAFHDLLASGSHRNTGVGKFVHTGNECDLTATDFLEHFGQEPDVKVIVLYIETIRDGRRFITVARQVTKEKLVVAYKAGRTPGGARAAQSHTAALAGTTEIYKGLLHQVGIIVSPTMELLLPLGHALLERPPMRGRKVAIVTMGGSWGVALTDFLEENGLLVPELSLNLQRRLSSLGMPRRASTRNPIDIGAIGQFPPVDTVQSIGREVLSSGEVDALILHGVGLPGMLKEDALSTNQPFLEMERQMILGFNSLEKEINRPVLIGNHASLWESQAIFDMNQLGIRIYQRIDEIAQLLSLMYIYWKDWGSKE